MNIASDPLLIALFLLQGVWGLFLIVLTWSMRRVLKDIEENTKATTKVAESVTGINVLLSGNYITKGDHERHDNRIRDLEKTITVLNTRDDYREMLRREGKL